jgi:hypothetical protein
MNGEAAWLGGGSFCREKRLPAVTAASISLLQSAHLGKRGRKVQDPVAITTYQSSFAVYMRSLDPSLLQGMRISESAVLVVEAFVSLCKALTDESDSRPWQERVEGCFAAITEERLQEMGQAFVTEFTGENPQRLVERLQSQNYIAFVKRLLGAASYRLLVQALKEDGAAIALAVRRGIRALTPFAVAWSDAVSVTSKNQLKGVQPSNILTLNAVEMLIVLDDFLGEKLLTSLPMDVTAATATDLTSWAPEGVDNLVSRFRASVTEASAKRIERANSPLVRKIRGARAALQYSEDGVSQAANSLIELLDRIMREGYTPEAVLAWVDSNLPDEEGLTYELQGQRRPTKRAEALCFVYGGDAITAREASEHDNGKGPDFLHDVIAIALVSARNQLQKLKHADSGTDEERKQLMSVLSAVEGALMLGLTMGSFSVDPSEPKALPAA